MKKRILFSSMVLVALVLWWLARPQVLSIGEIPNLLASPENGERVFLAGGCGSCHGDVTGDQIDATRLTGGMAMTTPMGVFHVPNISSDPIWGIGGWSLTDFVNAMKYGVSPDGEHYYPSFPYTSYTRMTFQDLVDLKAYLDGLPAVTGPKAGHQLKLPYRSRWSLGLWKRLYLDDSHVVSFPTVEPLQVRGRYLVEGVGHCGECHTPRNFLGAMDRSQWLAGAPSMDGKGEASNITPHSNGLRDWSREQAVHFMKTGVEPDFDLVEDEMVPVQENLSRLPDADLEAIAAYLEAVPAQP
jgi:mono/diheme cytochrome c family protein